MTNTKLKLSQNIYWYYLAIILTGLSGILLRTIQYMRNHSLWLDESLLAMNVLDRNFFQLLKPLNSDQSAPIGFLLSVKLLAKLFGTREYILRIIPFVSAIISIVLFLLLAQRLLGRKSTLAVMILFSFSPALISYSAEFKQYSSDVAVCLVMLLMAFYYSKKTNSFWFALLYGVIGSISIWFSHPVIFIMAGSGLTLAAIVFRENNRRNLFYLAIAGIMWMVSFAAVYWISLRFAAANKVLLEFWKDGFAPFPPKSLSALKWYLDAFLNFYSQTAKIPLTGVCLFCSIVGAFGFYREDRLKFALLISPIIFLLVASILHRYPFQDRLSLFLIPIFLVLIVKGIQYLGTLLTREAVLVSILLFGLVSFYPTYNSASNLLSAPGREEINQPIQRMRQHWQEGDVVYVSPTARPAFLYYARINQIPEAQYVIGKAYYNLDDVRREMEGFLGKKRVWFLFTRYKEPYMTFTTYILDHLGKKVQTYQADGAMVLLYDLSLH